MVCASTIAVLTPGWEAIFRPRAYRTGGSTRADNTGESTRRSGVTTRGCFYVTRSPLSSLKSARSCMPQNTSRDASVARRANARRWRIAWRARGASSPSSTPPRRPGYVAAARCEGFVAVRNIHLLSAASSCVTFPIRDLTPTVHPRHAGPRAPSVPRGRRDRERPRRGVPRRQVRSPDPPRGRAASRL